MRMKQRDARIANQSAEHQTKPQTDAFLELHYKHTAERLREHYNVIVTFEEWETLNQRVYDEVGCTFLFKPNSRTAVYRLKYRDIDLGVMFSTQMSCVTTVIPAEDCRLQSVKPVEKKAVKKDMIRAAHFG